MKPKSILAKSIATLLAGLTLNSALHALPQGAQVQSGAATFSQSGGALNIQTSDRAIINYQSFSIGGAERVNFIQPSAQSITLNRVTAPNPSEILGALTSNGKLVLANPYGIYFGPNSVINVGGLVAGAGHISDADFLAGRINFSSLSGDLVNRGNIIAVNDVGLYGAHVSNTGNITSQKGSVTLAAGSSVYVGEADGNIFVGTAPAAPAVIPKARVVSWPGGSRSGVNRTGSTTADAPRPAVKNSGTISAPKASLVAGDMYGIAIAQSGSIVSGNIAITGGKRGAVNVSGTLNASNLATGKTGGKISVKGDTIAVTNATLNANGAAGGGTIILDGGHNATTPTTVTSSGTITARGEGSGAKGGTVQMLGDHVGLFDSVVVDVSGNAGGGTALIGGDTHGANPNVQNATATYVGPAASINADALITGDGGKVVVWADDVTRFYGNISARGGVQSGNGGFAEVSGKESLAYHGLVDLRAPNGNTGTLLLDPAILTIQGGAGDGSTLANGGDGTNDGNLSFQGNPIGGPGGILSGDPSPTTVFQSEIENQSGTANILLQAGTSIVTSISVNGSFTGGNMVTLAPGSNLTMTAPTIDLTIGGGSTLAFKTQGSGTIGLAATGATASLTVGTLSSVNGSITLTSGKDITVKTGVSSTGSTVTFNFGQTIGGTLDLSAATPVTGTTVTAAGGVGPNTLKLSGAIFTLDSVTPNKGSSGTLTWTSIQNLTDTGAGIFNMGAGGSVSGGLSAVGGKVDYSSYGIPVTFDLANGSGVSTGIGTTWSGITTVTGGSATNTLTGANVANTWTITGANSGTVSGVTFSNIQNLVGGSATNQFTLSGGTLSGSINGGAGTSTLTGDNVANTFAITSANGGSATGVTGGFTNIANLVGGSATNQFTLSGGTLSGSINGGAGTSTLTGGNVPNTFTITSTNSGTATGVAGGFTNIANLVGGSVTNQFILALGGALIGSINGGVGTSTLNNQIAGSTFTMTGTNAGSVTNVGGNFSNIANLAGSGSDTLKATGATWTLNGANTGTVSNLTGTFSGMGNLTDLGAGTFNMHGTGDGGVSGNIVSTSAGSISYAGYTSAVTFQLGGVANQSTGITGTWSGITTATGSGNSDTMKGAGQTYTITGSDAGGNGTVSWTSFENLTDTGTGTLKATGATWTLNGANTGTVSNLTGTFSGMGNLTDLGAGTFNMHGTGDGSVSGNIVSTSAGSISYAGYTSAVTFQLGGVANQSTGITGTWSGIATATGSSNSDTMKGAGQTYNLTGSNAGNNGTVSWTSFENLTDTAAGNFKMHSGADGSVSGNINAVGGTLDYTGYTSAVTFQLGGVANQSTGITGTWSGITTATGSGNSDTMKGAGQTYTITGSDAGGNGTVSWTSFENLTDTGTGTLKATGATWTLNGANTGTVSNLTGTFSGMGNLTDLGAGTFNMHGTGDGSVSGNIVSTSAGSISYAGYTSAVTFQLGGVANQSTGITGTWSGITTATGSGNSDTMKGAGQTYTITGSDAGGNGTVSWTSFENLTDTGTGTLKATGATWTLNGANTGTVSNLTGTFSGMGNLTDLGAGTFNMHGTGDGSVSGNIVSTSAGSISYAGYTSAVTFQLGGVANQSTGITGTWSGIATATGSSNSDTMKGAGQTYNLTGSNAGNNGTVSWTSFENLTDTAGGTFNGVGGSITGVLTGTVGTTTFNGSITAGSVNVGAVTLGSDTVIDTSGGGGGTITLGAVSGATHNLTLQTGAVAGADVNGTSVSGVGTLQLQTIGGTASFTGAVSATAFNVPATVVNVSSTGTGGTITNAFAPVNTGTLTLGQAGGTQTYTGGLDTSGVGGVVTLNGTVNTTNTLLKTGAITLGSNTVLNSNATTGAGDIAIGAVTGGGFNLTLQTGAVAGADVNGTSVSGVGTLQLQTIGGTASFTGAVSATAFNVPATVVNVSSTGTGGTITNAFAPVNTGTLTLGQAGGTQTYTGGLDTSGVGGVVTLNGTVNTTNTLLKTGAITLGSNTVLNSNATTGAGDIAIGAVTGGGFNLTLQTGAVAGADVNGTSVSGVGTLQLQTIGGTASFTGAVSATAFNVPATVVNVSSTGTGGTITNAFAPVNTGTLTLGQAGGTQTYTGGLDTTGVLGTVTLSGTIQSSGPLTLGALSLAQDTTLQTNNIALTIGAVTGNSHALTLDAGAGGAINGTSADGVSTLKITNSSGTTFTGAIGATVPGAVTLTDTATTIAFQGNTHITTLTTAVKGYNVAFTGAANRVDNAATFLNTGTVTFGGGGTSTFTGGVTHTAGPNVLNGTVKTTNTPLNLNSATSVTGDSTLDAGSNTITLGAATLTDAKTLTLGTGAGTTINTSSIDNVTTANSSNVTINTTGVVTVGGVVGATKALNTVTVTNSGGTTFSGAVTAATATLTNTTGTIAFQGNTTLTGALNTAAQPYNVSLIGTANTIAGATTFLNTGTVTIGDQATDTTTFVAGVTATAPAVQMAGSILTNGGTSASFGSGSTAANLIGDTSVNTGAGAVTFGGTVDGAWALTVLSSGLTTFSKTIGGMMPLASLTTDAPGTISLPAFITTSGSLNIGEPVTLGVTSVYTSTAGGSINLNSGVSAGGGLSFTLKTSGSARIGPNSSLSLANFTPSVSSTLTIIGPSSITVSNPLMFTGPVAVQGNVAITTTPAGTLSEGVNTSSYLPATGGSLLQFDKTVDGPGTLTATSGGTLRFDGLVGSLSALGSLLATAPVIVLNSARTAGDLNVDAKSVTGSQNATDGLLLLTGSSYSSFGGSVYFNPTARATATEHATILSLSGNVAISAGATFYMGKEQKLLVDGGSLAISASTAYLGDMGAATQMNLTASAVYLQGRPVTGFHNSNRADGGLGFVSPTITFNTGSLAFTGGTTQKAVFSTRDSVASAPRISGVSFVIDSKIANQFGQQDVKVDAYSQPVNPAVVYGMKQPIASGTYVTDPGQAQLIFIFEIPKLVSLPEDTFLSQADKQILRDMGIYPRDATSDENITVSLRQGVFRQPIEGKAEMADPEFQVVLNRLTEEEIKLIIDKYTKLAGRKSEDLQKVALLLGQEVDKYHAASPGVSGIDGFTKWLQTQRGTDKSAEQLSQELDELAAVFVSVGRIGLTKKEIAICKLKICENLVTYLPGVTKEDILQLVESGTKIAPPTQGPGVPPPPGGATPAGPPPVPEGQAPLPPPPPPPEPTTTPPGDAATTPTPGSGSVTPPPPPLPPPAPDAPGTPKPK